MFFRKREHHDFLPAAISLEQTPASPAGRLLLWLIVLLFSTAIVWASASEVDIVAIARGKVIPTGHSKAIQPLIRSRVTEVHVQEGLQVRKGDLLVSLDDKETRADKSVVMENLHFAKNDLSRYRKLIVCLKQSDCRFLAGNNALLISRWKTFHDRQDKFSAQSRQLQAEKETLNIRIQKYKSLLPVIKLKSENFHKLADKKLASQQQYLEAEQQRIEMSHELKTLQAKRHEITAALKINKRLKALQRNETLMGWFEKQNDLEQKIGLLKQESEKINQKLDYHKIYSPVDGRVQQLVLHSVGAVVTPAQQLMVIVPDHVHLEIEAQINNRDIGFVQEGLPAEIKVDAFPFTRFGLIKGKVDKISRDAVSLDSQELVYKTSIRLDDDVFKFDRQRFPLLAGMSVQVEIKTGKRKLIDYFLSPLLQYQQESIRER